MSNWIVAAKVGEIARGDAKVIEIDNERIAVFNDGGAFYATASACPHAGGPLSEGFIEAGRIVCPWHAWSFPLDSNKAPADGLCRFQVRVEGDTIEVSRNSLKSNAHPDGN